MLIDMNQPEIDVRPIRQMTGDTEFCEVFLDGAYVASEGLPAMRIWVGRLRQVFLLMRGRRLAQHQFDSIDDLIDWVMTWEPSW